MVYLLLQRRIRSWASDPVRMRFQWITLDSPCFPKSRPSPHTVHVPVFDRVARPSDLGPIPRGHTRERTSFDSVLIKLVIDPYPAREAVAVEFDHVEYTVAVLAHIEEGVASWRLQQSFF